MRRRCAPSCFAPLAIAIAATPAMADVVTISAAQTNPVATSTANAGLPADVSISSAGSITPASGTAVTIDSANSVTNAGTLSITDADGSAGIVANAGTTGSITNSGTGVGAAAQSAFQWDLSSLGGANNFTITVPGSAASVSFSSAQLDTTTATYGAQSVVPEPSTVAALAVGGLGLGLLGRRLRRRAIAS